MRLLDTAAVVAALATATGRPHMLVRATSKGVMAMRCAQTELLPSDVLEALDADGSAIVSGSTFVDGALGFWNLEQALVAQRIQGVTMRLVQADGSVRIHDGVDAVVARMPMRAAA